MTNLNTLSSLTTPAIVAFVTTLASALAISIALHNKSKSKKATMPTTPKDGEKKAGAASAATRDRDDPPDLLPPLRYRIRSQSLFTIKVLPPKAAAAAAAPPSSRLRAMLVFAHGIGEHCCRPGYVELFGTLSRAGVDVRSMDHHGHGRSDGRPRGYADKFDDYVVDVVDYVRHCRTECADDGSIIDARRLPPSASTWI